MLRGYGLLTRGLFFCQLFSFATLLYATKAFLHMYFPYWPRALVRFQRRAALRHDLSPWRAWWDSLIGSKDWKIVMNTSVIIGCCLCFRFHERFMSGQVMLKSSPRLIVFICLASRLVNPSFWLIRHWHGGELCHRNACHGWLFGAASIRWWRRRRRRRW